MFENYKLLASLRPHKTTLWVLRYMSFCGTYTCKPYLFNIDNSLYNKSVKAASKNHTDKLLLQIISKFNSDSQLNL